MEGPNSSPEFPDKRDPGIDEIDKLRKVKEDLAMNFGCAPEQIATSASEVNETTTAYIGTWNPTIAIQIQPHLSRIAHLYESYPDKPIFYKNLKTDQTLTPEIATQKISVSPFCLTNYGGDLISKIEFSQTEENYELVVFSVAQLGFSANGATTEEIYTRAASLGLELCPAEVGPQLRLQYTNQPKGNFHYLWIAMKQILDGEEYPRVFGLDHNLEGLRLIGSPVRPGYTRAGTSLFVFRLASSRK